jgi:predicted metalloprotease with PDZ domain
MKVKYSLHVDQPHQQYIRIEVIFPVDGAETNVFLPTWRPGRYEIGDFAKNVRKFEVIGAKNKKLSFEKTHKAVWKVDTANQTEIKVVYQYYSTDLNGGSTFLSKEQLYVNPVNCFVFTDETVDNAIEVKLNIPSDYKIATNLEHKDHVLFAVNFDQLADSPFIASNSLQHDFYDVKGTRFHLWFQGLDKVNWELLKKDFTAFTEKQIEKFTEFPVKDYHFLFQIVPYRAYHGVEHEASTVILLGPTYDIFKGMYKELLGVSSHELYHTWNVKAIRPIEMYPYDFKKENFSRLGYLCEGVTTYMGDLFLYKSKVFDFIQYTKEFSAQLQKHFDNQARFHYSVAESSYDTWLDGYQAGAPGRKVSIYTEGCLLAFLSDMRIRKATVNKYGLDEVMKRLYFEYYLEGKGVSESDYKFELERITGEDWTEMFKDYFHGTKGFERPIHDALDYMGLELIHSPSNSYSESNTGIKTAVQGGQTIVISIYPGSPADMAGMMLEDTILAVNGHQVQVDLDQWLNYHDDDNKTLTIQRKGRVFELGLPVLNRTFYNVYTIQHIKKPTVAQKNAFDHWSK